MRGQQTCPLYNIYLYHVNSKVGRQHTKASLAAAIGSFMSLPTHPSHYVNDVATRPGPLLFSNGGVGSFTSHKNR